MDKFMGVQKSVMMKYHLNESDEILIIILFQGEGAGILA